MKTNKIKFLSVLLLGGLLATSVVNGFKKTNEVKADEIPTTCTKVTALTDLTVGDKVLIVGNDHATTQALSSSTSAKKHYLVSAGVTISGNNLTYTSASGIKPFTLVAGKLSDTYAFKNDENKYLRPYSLGENGLSYEASISNASSWTIDLITPSIKSNFDGQAYDSCVYIKYNSSTQDFRAYKSSSGTVSPSIYKLSSSGAKVSVDKSTASILEGSSTTITANAEGFTPTSYSWVSSNPSNVEITSGANESSVTVKGLSEGSSTLTVTCDDNPSLVASCEVTVISKAGTVLEDGDYFIVNYSNEHMLGVDKNDIEKPDFADATNLWTIANNGEDGNRYTISNGTKYLIHGGSGGASAISLSDDSSSYWIVSKNTDESYTFEFSGSGNKLSCNPSANSGKWFAYASPSGTQDHINLLKVGTYVSYEVAKANGKKNYRVGDTFNPTNFAINAIYDNGAKVDITSLITWDVIKEGTKATGKAIISGAERSFEIDGLKIFKGDASTFVVTGLNDEYYANEKVDKTLLSASITFKCDGESDDNATLTSADLVVSPEVITSDTTSIRVSLAKDPSVYVDKNITVKENHFVATNYIGVGDIITIGTLGYDPYEIKGGVELDNNGTSFTYSNFGYMPLGKLQFEVGKVNSYYTFRNIANDKYLRGDASSFKYLEPDYKTATRDNDGTQHFNLNVTIAGETRLITMTTSADPDFSLTNVFSAYLNLDNTYLNYIQGESDLVNNKLIFNYYEYNTDPVNPIETVEVSLASWELNGGIFRYALSISSELPEECLFTASYNEDLESWSLSSKAHQDKQCYYNKDGKFGFYAIGSSYTDIMIFRDNSRPLQSEVTSLSVSFLGGMDSVSVNETFPWTSSLIVAAHYNGGAFKQVPVGGYTYVAPDTSKIGSATGKVIFGQEGHEIEKEFTITVKGKTQAFVIKGDRDPILVGEECQLRVEPAPADGEPITWSIDEPSFASISNTGLLTGLAPGYVNVTATSYDGSYSDTVKIRIYRQVESVLLNTHQETLVEGSTYLLVATISPSDASNQTVSYESSNTNVVTVNSKTGLVTATGAGTATVTVTSQNQNKTDSCVFIVTPRPVTDVLVTSVSLNHSDELIGIGDTLSLIATINPDNATNKNVFWSSSNPLVASVEDGLVTGLKEGNAVITVTTQDGGYNASCKVLVSKNVISVDSISIICEKDTMKVGEDQLLQVVINPDNATNKNITWSSNDEQVAIVDSTGKVTAISEGSVIISATTSDGNKTSSVVITVTNSTGGGEKPTDNGNNQGGIKGLLSGCKGSIGSSSIIISIFALIGVTLLAKRRKIQ